MKATTVRQLRHDFGTVLSWVEEGEEVEVRKRGRVVAHLVPAPPVKPRRKKMPDFAARLRKIFGNQPPIPYNMVVRERDESKW